MAFFKGGIFSKRRELESFFVNSYGNDQTRGVYTFNIDIDTGELFMNHHFKTPSDPMFSFNYGRFVCTTYKNKSGSTNDGGVCSYASTAQTLGLVSRVSNQGKTYMHACTNGDDITADRFIGVDYYNGEIMVVEISKKKLKKVLCTYKLSGRSVHKERQTMPHPHFVCMTPDFKKVIVVDLGLDKIMLFDLNEEGTLILDEKHSFCVEAGSGPRSLTFNGDGTMAYVVNELTNTIDCYQYDNYVFNKLNTIDTYDKERFDNETSLASDFILTEDQQYALVLNRGHDSISLFKVLENGLLQYLDFADTSSNPRCMEIFRDRYIVIGCQKGGILEVVELSREKDGLLFGRNHSYLVNEPVCIRKFIDITQRKN